MLSFTYFILLLDLFFKKIYKIKKKCETLKTSFKALNFNI